MPPVDFARLSRSPADYEDMVSVLLSRIWQARRVDGSGGDGGRDCYFTDADGTDVYELKSFTGRMGRTQRRQVERSLRRAMNDSPRSWTPLRSRTRGSRKYSAWHRTATVPPRHGGVAGHGRPTLCCHPE